MNDPRLAVAREEKVVETDFMSLVDLYVELPSGQIVRRPTIRRIDAVVVVAVFGLESDSAEILLERQYRPALDCWLLELPAGRLDIPGEQPRDAAIRELKEETGYVAGRVEELFTVAVTPGWSDEKLHFYFATDLEFHGTEFDSEEESHMEIVKMPVAALPDLISSGEIFDAKTIIGSLIAHRRWSSR